MVEGCGPPAARLSTETTTKATPGAAAEKPDQRSALVEERALVAKAEGDGRRRAMRALAEEPERALAEDGAVPDLVLGQKLDREDEGQDHKPKKMAAGGVCRRTKSADDSEHDLVDSDCTAAA